LAFAQKVSSPEALSASTLLGMKVAIEGMHCEACVKRVRKALEKAGARVESVQVGSAAVAIDGDQEEVVLAAVRDAGYEPRKIG
jgi:copper chaperone CopZ